MKPRMIMVDDHKLVLAGLERMLGEHFEVLAALASGADLLAEIPERQPDVVVLDLSMPGLTGLDLLRLLRRCAPSTRFLVLTMHADLQYARQAFAAGAHGYMLKSAAPAELVAAVWAVVHGGRVVSPGLEIDAETLAGRAGAVMRAGSGALTARQRRVLREIACGTPCKRIADALGISPKTVEFHRTCIARQLGLRSTAALTRYALDHGMLGPDAATDPSNSATDD